MQSERERLPDLRQSVTKKIVIRHTHEDVEKALGQAQEKLDRVRALVTAPAKKDPGEDCTDANSATLEAVRRVVDEPVKVTPTITDDVKIYAQVGLYPDGRPVRSSSRPTAWAAPSRVCSTPSPWPCRSPSKQACPWSGSPRS